MKYYCELNKTFYNTEEECCAAEQEILAAKSEEERMREEELTMLAKYKEEMMVAQENYREASRIFTEAKKNYNNHAMEHLRKYGNLPESYAITPDTIWNFFVN